MDAEKSVGIDNGWVKLHRKLLYNPIIQRPAYAWLWVILLMKAGHKEEKFMWNGGLITVKEGGMLTSRDKLAKLSGIKSSTVEDILRYLESQQQIRQESKSTFRLIYIVNWHEYQMRSDSGPTAGRQRADTYKNTKKVKKDTLQPDKPVAPFNFKEYMEGMKVNPRKHIQLIAFFLRKKGITFDSEEEVKQAILRHAPAASRVVKYNKDKVNAAVRECEKMKLESGIEWTIETIEKVVTRQQL